MTDDGNNKPGVDLAYENDDIQTIMSRAGIESIPGKLDVLRVDWQRLKDNPLSAALLLYLRNKPGTHRISHEWVTTKPNWKIIDEEILTPNYRTIIRVRNMLASNGILIKTSTKWWIVWSPETKKESPSGVPFKDSLARQFKSAHIKRAIQDIP